jgi:uncharacterized membrane protein
MARRPHGLIYGALAASLAVNLIGAGYVGYTAWRPKPPRTVESTIAFVSGRYADPIGEAIRVRLEAERGALGTALKEMKQARRATRQAMAAEPFDRARLDALFEEARAKAAAFQRLLHGAIADATAEASPADRAKLDRSGDD